MEKRHCKDAEARSSSRSYKRYNVIIFLGKRESMVPVIVRYTFIPKAPIYFGAIHCIALNTLLTMFFVRVS